MPSIDLRAVRFGYKNARQKTEALHGVDLSIADGEFVCVIGPSGCGKSTLLRLLAGLDMPDGGEISIGGQPVEGPGADRMIAFQDYALFPWLTAEKNISFALSRAKRVPRAEAKRTAAEYLQKVGMAQAADYYPCQLSGGMKQRVAIARALAARWMPRYVLPSKSCFWHSGQTTAGRKRLSSLSRMISTRRLFLPTASFICSPERSPVSSE